MQYKSPPLVFVYKGDNYQSYINYSLRINKVTANKHIVLLTDNPKLLNLSISNIEIIDFNSFYKEDVFINAIKNLSLDENFLNGFWLRTLERFFILLQWVQTYKVHSFFHAELDNIIFNIDKLECKLDMVHKGMFIPLTLDYKTGGLPHGIASLMYINCVKSLEDFCLYVEKRKKEASEVELLGGFVNNDCYAAAALPSDLIFANIESDLFIEGVGDVLFDAAALGQWYFGRDPRFLQMPVFNHFKHQRAILNFDKMKAQYDSNSNCFYIYYSGKKYRLYNLHVHSKVHKKILMRKNFFQNIIARSNKGKKSLIYINPMGCIKFTYMSFRLYVFKKYIVNLFNRRKIQ